MCEKWFPIRMSGEEFVKLKNVAVVVLRAEQIAKFLAIIPRLQCSPIQQAIEHFTGSIEWQLEVIPSAVAHRGEVLVSGFVFLETDFGSFCHAATHCQIRGVGQFNFEKENEVLKQINVFEEEEFGVAACQEAEVKN